MPAIKTTRSSVPVTEISFLKNPTLVLHYFLLYVACQIRKLWKIGLYYSTLVGVLLGFVVVIGAFRVHSPVLEDFWRSTEEHLLWCLRWFVLGVLSSVGLGTGAHTFVLFLGPWIAETTNAARICSNLEFKVAGPSRFQCLSDRIDNVSLFEIFSKICKESFLWGAGTAVGELPPYFLARASAQAGHKTGEISDIDRNLRIPRNKRTWAQSVSVAMFYMVDRLGFYGILLCASIPNPLFDLAGITCGYYQIPFFKFFLATLVGKALIKASIQSLFVIIVSSPESFGLIDFLHDSCPWLGRLVQKLLDTQKRSMLPGSSVDTRGSMIGILWNGLVGAMMGIFVLSLIQSLAQKQAEMEKQS